MRVCFALSLLALSVLSVSVERAAGQLLGNADGSPVCDVLQMDGFYHTQTYVPTFETCNYAQAPASLRFCTDNYGYQHQDQCKWQCSTNHTITLSLFSRYHTFNLVVNGYVLTASGWMQLPYNFRSVSQSVWNNWPLNKGPSGALPVQYTPLTIGISSPYFTGQYNTPNSAAPNTYTCPAPWILITEILEVVLGYAPIYQIPFPYWSCSPSSLLDTPSSANTIKNFVSVNVAWQLDGIQVCAQPNGQDFVYTRNCSVTTGNNTLPSTPSGSHAHGDPQFAGLRGQDYQVHGVDGGIYNIISDKYMQLNSKFVFLTGPRPCPMIPTTGRKSVACFHHSGSYLGNLALLTNADDRVLIESGPAERGLSTVEVNGERLIMGDNVTLSFNNGHLGHIHYLSTHEVTLTVGLFEIEIENSDSFINLRSAIVRSSKWQELINEKAHGLLGQTWNLRKGKSAIEGKVDDYLLESADLFGTDFMYNRFGVMDEDVTEEQAAA